MKPENEFYIGWQEKMPLEQKRFLKKILRPLFVIMPLIVLLVVYVQNPFNNHSFQIGNVSEFTGIYRDSPVPLLILSPDQLPDEVSSSVLLVGYGKFGAEGIIADIENEEKASLDGREITIRGTIISGDGKAILELTEKQKSLVNIGLVDTSKNQEIVFKSFEDVELKGEILDPKCYFGVMKPGEGKVHKSCAIRCISGGIPPIFRPNVNGENKYYILLGMQGEKINQDILDLVAEPISISGKASNENGWRVLYVNPASISIIN